MRDIKEIREKHKQEILVFQEDCSHEKGEWRRWAWAPGHYGGEVRVCVRCGKILERRNPQVTKTFKGKQEEWKLTEMGIELSNLIKGVDEEI